MTNRGRRSFSTKADRFKWWSFVNPTTSQNVTNDPNSTIDVTEINESFHDSSIILGSVATFLIMIILSVLEVIIAIVIQRWKARRVSQLESIGGSSSISKTSSGTIGAGS